MQKIRCMKKLLKTVNETLDNYCSYNIECILYTLKEELEIEINTLNNYEINKNKAILLSNETKKIQIGCGKNLLNDYINIDLNEQCDVYWDIRKGLPFENESLNEIFSEHVFEHMDYPISANKFLSESYRTLRKEGYIIIGVPDCDYPLKDIFNNDDSNMKIAKERWYKNRAIVLDTMNTNLDYLNYVMRDQLYDKKYHPHYWGYNKENLTLLLKKHGFKNIEIWKPDINIINPKRKWGTLYLIARK